MKTISFPQASVGIWFSDLKDNWEECAFYYNFSCTPGGRHDERYRHHGDFPDGRHFGAFLFPKSLIDPPITIIMIVDEKGEMKPCTPAEHGHWEPAEHYWPMAVTASPSGKSLVWITEGELWVWHEDEKEEHFITDMGECLTPRIGERKVQDAKMHADGILEFLLENGETLGFFCDEGILLIPWENGWVPAEDNEWRVKEHLNFWPDSLSAIIRQKDDSYDYFDSGIRRVCFEPELEVIKPGMLSDNPDLESVTIPASVKEVQSWAFGSCTNLKELLIEGDLSRVADWAEDAFECCACEEYYKKLRNASL